MRRGRGQRRCAHSEHRGSRGRTLRMKKTKSRCQPAAVYHAGGRGHQAGDLRGRHASYGTAPYVDGNGGNISYRIGPNEVICTPTLVSKFDLTPDDLCLVDLEGKQIAGKKPRTSEILLHLEIYKAVPEAKACVHCHPPHATAYAITGQFRPAG